MDIYSKAEGAAGVLSNFTALGFCFDGVLCASMEGFLQSLKFEDIGEQQGVCAMAGEAAKIKGMERDEAWRAAQTLWWQGAAMAREGEAYQALLDRAYRALFDQNATFRAALAETREEPLSHTIGKSDPRETILTEREFCSRLTKLREEKRAIFD